MSTLASIAEWKSAKVARRRSALGRNGHSIALLGFVACLGVIALQQFAGDEHGRKLEGNYAPGMCDGYVYTNYYYIVLALMCWSIYYMFWGLAIVCDDYFVASLEAISEALGLSSDVAGATFMAAGSSAPELFTSLMGVFAVKNDVGVGTIVGSAVFNLCCIIGGTAMFTPTTLVIDWKPITRDTLFYGLSIAAMIAEPTTAASACAPTCCTCSGLLMPKPTAIGVDPDCFRTRPIKPDRSDETFLRCPVTPLTLTQ